MEKIDKRRHYVLVVDTETANTIQDGDKLDMSNVLVYDCGWQVVDTHGNVYTQASYVNKDIFIYEKELMQSAYYANKIPQYEADLQAGTRIMSDTYGIRQAMLADMDKFNIKEVAAHNARFDLNALNSTQRYITKSNFRYWFPYGTQIIDTMKMAKSVICKMPTYQKFCIQNGYLTKTGQPRKTAEILYRFISGNIEFEENHTGLEDVQIETEIFWYCYRQHKSMVKYLFEDKPRPVPTNFQRSFALNLKENPTIRV